MAYNVVKQAEADLAAGRISRQHYEMLVAEDKRMRTGIGRYVPYSVEQRSQDSLNFLGGSSTTGRSVQK